MKTVLNRYWGTHALNRFSIAKIFVITLSFSLFALSANTIHAQYTNIVINEISGDGGNVEAGNDAIVELAGPPGADIGCMVLTNTEWAIVLPAGTQIPADGVFLIGCEERDNPSTGFYTGLNTGLSCSVCDFPGLVVDFDVCNIENSGYISSSTYAQYGFTLDNNAKDGNVDGDQVLLFRPDGTPHDGVYWGAPDQTNSNGGATTVGGASGNKGAPSDHVSAQIGHPYTLGDNDENGIVNDFIGDHIGYKANGSDALGVPIMPTGNDDLGNPELFGMLVIAPPGDCNAHQKNYTVPALSNPVWVNIGLSLVSCNSTHIRINDTSPSGNSRQEEKSSTTSSHMDDPDLNTDWMAYDATALSPSSINPTAAAAQWQITNHPNPSKPNDVDSWDFFYDIGVGNVEVSNKEGVDISLCSPQTVTFELQVYNYQHVEPTIRSTQVAGSFVRDETGTDQAWTISTVGHPITAGTAPSNDDGITTLQFTSNNLLAGSDNTFVLVWDDYTDCCGSGNNSTVVNQSKAHECYEKIRIDISVGEVVTVSQNTVSCPGDFPANIGTIDFSDFVTSTNAKVQYRLKESVTASMEETTGVTVEVNTSGIFNLTNMLTPPFAVIIEDVLNCGPNQVITIGDDCRNAPPCPSLKGAMSSAATICPEDNFTLSVDGMTSTDLPNGGTIDWYYGTATNFDPLDANSTGFGGKLPNASEITSPCPAGGSNVFISELSDPIADWQCHRYIEIYNGGPCSQDLTDWVLYAIGNNTQSVIFNLSGSIQPGEAKIAAADCATNFIPDFVIPGSEDWDGSFPGRFNGQSRDGAELYDKMGNLVDAAVISTTDGNDWFENDLAVRLPTVCTGFNTATTLCGTATTCANLISNWAIMAGDDSKTPGTHSVTAGICPSSMATVTSAINTFDSEFCNQTLFIKGVVSPATVNAGTCSQADFTTATLTIQIDCPEADLQEGDKSLCLPVNPSEVLATINLANGSGTYNVVSQLNHKGTDYTLTKVGVSNPLQITYADVMTALGAAVFSDVALSLMSVSDVAGSQCTGKIDEDIVNLTVLATPTASIIAATNLTDCTGAANGSVTFQFLPVDSGPWEFEYTINDGNPITSATGNSTFILPTSTAGIYELQSVTSAAGCKGTIGIPSSQTVNSPTLLSVQSATTATICNDGLKSVDLDTDITLTIDDNGSSVVGNAATIGNITWYQTAPSLLPDNLLSSLSIPTTSFVPMATEQEYFFIYKRPLDGCEAVGKASVVTNSAACSSIVIPPVDAEDAEEEEEEEEEENIASIPTMSEWGLLIFGLLLLNLGVMLILRMETI